MTPPCSEAAFVVKSEPHTEAIRSVRACKGLKIKKTAEDLAPAEF
jgi:hypothetical protein